jgi:hypothetical protein
MALSKFNIVEFESLERLFFPFRGDIVEGRIILTSVFNNTTKQLVPKHTKINYQRNASFPLGSPTWGV